MKELSKSELIGKITELENKLIEAEETIEAIKFDKIDALVISTHEGDQIYTLEGADRPYRIFLEQMNEGAVTIANDGTILYCNKRFAEMVETPLEKIFGCNLADFADPDESDRLNLFLQQRHNPAKEEINFKRGDKSNISIYLSLTQLVIEGLEPFLCIIATDLTEKKKSEEIVAAEKLARSILEQTAEAIVVCDENLKIIRANKAAEALAGEPVLYKHFDKAFSLSNNNNKSTSLNYLIKNPSISGTELNLITDDKKKNLIVSQSRLAGNNNKILGYVVSLTNITKHIEAEAKLTNSLFEKTVLLKEIHHRVKNNLQIISSLLALQSVSIKDTHLLDILNECRNRINSMALIHQKLYEARSLASISIPDYLKELISSLRNIYRVKNCEVNLDLPPNDISLTIETAIPLGLVMNELVTNSLTHAFKNHDKGAINISIIPSDDNHINILMKDTGSGFPDHLDFYNPSRLGLQLVHTLIEQMNGSIEMKSPVGTEINISIPMAV